MKIYIDCCLVRCSVEERRERTRLHLGLVKHLRSTGFSVLDFEINGLGIPSDRLTSVDLIEAADAVIAIGDYPSVGFSSMVHEVCKRRPKPLFVFWHNFMYLENKWFDSVYLSNTTSIIRFRDYDEIVTELCKHGVMSGREHSAAAVC